MNLNQIHLFVRVADTQSFTRAASELGLQRSSVSRSVSAFEADLGVSLFHRSTRSVALTTAGEALYERVAPQLASILNALKDVPELADEPAGPLLITLPQDMGATLFAPIFARFCQRYPKVQLDVRITNRVVDLVAEGFDAAIRPGPLPDSSLKVVVLGVASAGLYAAPNYLSVHGQPTSLDDAFNMDWIAGPIDKVVFGGDSAAAVSSDDFLFVREMVRLGRGIGGLPSFLITDDLASDALVRLPITLELPPLKIQLVMPPSEPAPRKLTVLREFLLEHFRVHPLTGA